MSSSKAASSKIEFLDSAENVTEKILACHFEENDLDRNGILAMVRMIIIPLTRLKNFSGDSLKFSCVMADGRSRDYQSYDEVVLDYKEGNVSVASIKTAVALTVNRLLEPIRQEYASNEEWQEIAEHAYSI